jgi:hypothetical protein
MDNTCSIGEILMAEGKVPPDKISEIEATRPCISEEYFGETVSLNKGDSIKASNSKWTAESEGTYG